VAEFLLTSTAVVDGGTIPRRYTLRRRGSLAAAVVVGTTRRDRFAGAGPGRSGRARGRFIHWLAWDMTPDITGLGEGEAAPLEGRNDFGTVGYRGPCPPGGHGRHRYRFRLHAVAGDLGLAPGAGVRELERAVAAKVVAVAELVGTYQR